MTSDVDLIRMAIKTGAGWRELKLSDFVAYLGQNELHAIETLFEAIPAFRRVLLKYVRCEHPQTCCEIHDAPEHHENPGLTHYFVRCGTCDSCKLLEVLNEEETK